MALDPSIILQGQAPNILGAISAGNDAAQNQLGYQRQREIENLYKTQGAGILAGDQNALNALAGYSPEAALGVQQNQLGMQQTQQQMAFSAEEMQMKRAEGKRLAEERMADKAATLTKEQAAQAAAQLDKAIQAGATAQTPEQWDAIVTQFGETELVGQFAQKDAILAGAMGFKDWFDAFGPKAGPEWRAATPEEAAANGAVAGQINTKTGKFDAQNPPSSMSMTTNPDGTMTLKQGPGAANDTGMTPSDPQLMINTIDGILNDPALDSSTGLYSPLQNVPGTPMKRFQGRAQQLQGQAFLQAFKSLKGSGQITEVEGAKATQAIGRLNTEMSAKDYRDALNELRDVLVLGASRPVGWATGGSNSTATDAQAAPPAPITTPGGTVLRFDAEGNIIP